MWRQTVNTRDLLIPIACRMWMLALPTSATPEVEGVFQLLDEEKQVIQITGTMNLRQDKVSDLEAQGWICQFIVETERADEYQDLYESLGNESRVEPITPDLMVADECATCLLVTCDRYVVIYTRPREDKHGSEV